MRYSFYVASNIKVYSILLYIASTILAIDAAFLRVGNGTLMTQCPDEFDKLRHFNQFFGNSLAALLFTCKILEATMHIVLTAINTGDTFLFLPIKQLSNLLSTMNINVSQSQNENERRRTMCNSSHSNAKKIQQEQNKHACVCWTYKRNIKTRTKETYLCHNKKKFCL